LSIWQQETLAPVLGTNLFSYAGDSPTNASDPSGAFADPTAAIPQGLLEVGSGAALGTYPLDIPGILLATQGIRTANLLVNELIEADRKARRISREGPEYDSALFEAAGPMITLQVARAASALASIWLYEWKSAGTPSPCSTRR